MSNIDYTITRHWKPTKSSPFYVRNTYMGDNVLSIAKSTADAPSVTVQYSYDNATWTTLGTTTTTPLELNVPKHAKVYLRATANAWANADGYNYINMQHSHKICGNIMSLLAGSSFDGTETTISTARAFQKLFYNDTMLTDASMLKMPATTISQYCYASMFYMCTNMVGAPEIFPALTLQPYCYSGTFTGCSSLVSAPELPATTLKQFCYAGMFSACTSLGKIVANFESWPTNSALTDTDYHATWEWTRYMKADGLFKVNNAVLPETKNAAGNQTDAHYIPYDWTVEQVNYQFIPFFVDDISGNASTLTVDTSYSDATDVEYSLDGTTWTSTNPGVPANGRVYIRANATYWSNDADYIAAKIYSNHAFNIGGNLMSLFYGSDFTGYETVIPGDVGGSCAAMFAASGVVSAAGLTLGASNFTTAQDIFRSMFEDCTSLTGAPKLQSTTLYHHTYERMFKGCTSLVTAPALPATDIPYWNTYSNMFEGCTSLTVAPELPSNNIGAVTYSGMFAGCTSLNTIKVGFTAWSEDEWMTTQDWTFGLPSTGTFYCPAALAQTKNTAGNQSNASYIPYDWTVVIA